MVVKELNPERDENHLEEGTLRSSSKTQAMTLRLALNESRKMADSSDVVTPPLVLKLQNAVLKPPTYMGCHQQSGDHQKVAQNADHFDAHLTTIVFFVEEIQVVEF